MYNSYGLPAAAHSLPPATLRPPVAARRPQPTARSLQPNAHCPPPTTSPSNPKLTLPQPRIAGDRNPFLSFAFDGKQASVKQAQNPLHHNVVVSNYAAYAGCFDHDDGASYADMYNNFCLGGGHKNNYDGHSKHSFNNVYAFPLIYGERCFGFFSTFLETIRGQPEVFENNICVQDSMQNAQSGYQAIWIMGQTGLSPNNCPSSTDPSFPPGGLGDIWRLAKNTYYVPAGGNLSLGCGDLPAAFRDYVSMGWETDPTVVYGLPTAEQIIAMARALVDG